MTSNAGGVYDADTQCLRIAAADAELRAVDRLQVESIHGDLVSAIGRTVKGAVALDHWFGHECDGPRQCGRWPSSLMTVKSNVPAGPQSAVTSRVDSFTQVTLAGGCAAE